MRVVVDRDRCEGHGQCAAASPSVFALDDSDTATTVVPDGVVPPELEQAALLGADVCPVMALLVEAPPTE